METTSNAHLKRALPVQSIEALKVTNPDERLLCLPNIAGWDCVVLEHTIYDMLSILSDDYGGGFWDYYRLSNGGFFMAPTDQTTYRMRSHANFFEGVVAAETAGLIATAMAYSHLSFRPRGSNFAMAYQLLCEFIFQHPDAGTIRAALD
jgi:hypothetical protein